ncbi:replication-relaxation family protein [Allomesorhizobium alhagi]|uniref:Uncharacterized protein n=1 Tax=Mesorhizobium alhagi CCNWXJ12-2 TaxID=1107882 RepID=H0HQC7_9HYPH|nr:replication-relaxation family protein [Mesorhizobium alhagi]EHK57049.1 hypothetical protein MAXJ12_11787 [Mesorhizobium alhagi CCNWXJ12-2]
MVDQKTHDTLHRRRRDRPHSTDKRVTPQERDLLWFQKIHQHGPLSSTYLHAFSESIARNEKRARDRLTDLFNESRTRHGGAYLCRPWQQFRTFDARYQDLVYDLADASEAALRENGLWHDSAQGSGPWTHRYMVSCITASIELATLNDPNLTFIPQHVILKRAGASSLRYPVPCLNPANGKTEIKDLIPDALFGLEYKKDGTSFFRFFVVEADRSTEPSRTQTFNRKSHLRNFLQYRQYVGGGLYKDHLKLTAPLLVLNVTTSERAMANMIKLALEISPGGNTYLLFRCCPLFGRHFKPAKPLTNLLRADWIRAGELPLQIS